MYALILTSYYLLELKIIIFVITNKLASLKNVKVNKFSFNYYNLIQVYYYEYALRIICI